MTTHYAITYLLSFALFSLSAGAQQNPGPGKQHHPKSKQRKDASGHYNSLYQFGVADAFVGGLFKGQLPVSQLMLHGDFGLGAPDMLDGELTINNGIAYQAKSTGQMIQAPDTLTTSLAFVCFFKADTSFRIGHTATQKEALQLIDNYLTNKNGLYAIRISGDFDHLRTRAFPRFDQEPPFPPLATRLNTQQFFEFNKVKGTMVGYKMPSYLGGTSIEGFHFHFLSDQLNAGGHVVDFIPADAQIEIAVIRDFKLEIPQDKDFENFNFKATNKSDLDKVEKGK